MGGTDRWLSLGDMDMDIDIQIYIVVLQKWEADVHGESKKRELNQHIHQRGLDDV